MGNTKKICLVCSSGGHLLELYSLKKFWSSYKRCWVTFYKGDSLYHLSNEKVYIAYSPTNRNIKNFIRNMILAFRILKNEKPNCVISTGAGVGVSFIFVSKFLKIKTIYIESLTRIESLSLTGKLLYFLTDNFIVQWPELTHKYRRSIYQGQII